jgi:hypothetical protein
MVRKKLVTLACAVGLLACGACFLPPLPQPAPPPLRLPLGRSRAVRVEVTNDAPTHHIDPVEFRGWIVAAINLQRQPVVPPAHIDGEASPDDAVLQIHIVDESAIAEPANPAVANAAAVQVTLDATLTRPDGAIVWRQMHRLYRSDARYRFADSADPWSSPSFAAWVHDSVCHTLVSQMLDGKP